MRSAENEIPAVVRRIAEADEHAGGEQPSNGLCVDAGAAPVGFPAPAAYPRKHRRAGKEDKGKSLSLSRYLPEERVICAYRPAERKREGRKK